MSNPLRPSDDLDGGAERDEVLPNHDHDLSHEHIADQVSNRRVFLRRVGLAAGVAAIGGAAAVCTSSPTVAASSTTQGTAGSAASGPGTTVACAPGASPALARPETPKQVFDALVAGNERFATNKSIHPNLGEEIRAKQNLKQTPFAAVLTCADSRTTPEIIFDQGIGDLFVVRVAGNIADAAGIASLAYAVAVLGVDVIVVMGHESCGAVDTTIKVVNGDAQAGEFAVLTDAIAPAVKVAQSSGATGNVLLNASIDENAKLAAELLTQRSPILGAAETAGELIVASTVYVLETSRAQLLD